MSSDNNKSSTSSSSDKKKKIIYNGVTKPTIPTNNLNIDSIFKEVVFIDTANNCEIDQETIISSDTSGITVSINGITSYIPIARIKLGIVTTADGSTIDSIRNWKIGVNPPTINLINNYYSSITPTFSSDIKTISKLAYFFGIDKVSVKKRMLSDVCASLSASISIAPYGYLQIDADYYENDNASVEFYIIDDNKEIPILSSEITQVNNERIFPQLNTRFSIKDKTSVIIKENGEVVNTTFAEAQLAAEKTGKIYTITYTPTDDAYQYETSNSIIYIKTILRKYKNELPPPYVESVVVKRYGGSLNWIK